MRRDKFDQLRAGAFRNQGDRRAPHACSLVADRSQSLKAVPSEAIPSEAKGALRHYPLGQCGAFRLED